MPRIVPPPKATTSTLESALTTPLARTSPPCLFASARFIVFTVGADKPLFTTASLLLLRPKYAPAAIIPVSKITPGIITVNLLLHFFLNGVDDAYSGALLTWFKKSDIKNCFYFIKYARVLQCG